MVEGRWPVVDLGVSPFLLADVRSRAPVLARSFGKSGWFGMRIPMVSKWS